MAHDSSSHDEHHQGIGHVAPLRALLGTGVALLILTWVTVVVAKVDLGEMNIFLALGVAVLKATLVALFFMHLRWDRPFNAIVFVGSLAFVMLFIALALVDTAEYQVERDPGDAPLVIQQLQENAAAATAPPAASPAEPAAGH